MRCIAVLSLLGLVAAEEAVTCGHVKDFYKKEGCCKNMDKPLEHTPPGCPACPYNFEKPKCEMANAQSPRDLTPGAEGHMTPKAPVLTAEQAMFLPLVNVHFHLGAEHKSLSYSDGNHSHDYDEHFDGRRLEGMPRPGFMCRTDDLTMEQAAPYEFEYCMGEMHVGASYEVHWVHSSAGYTKEMLEGVDQDGIDDGLGGAANGRGMLNPMIAVQGQVLQLVNGAPDEPNLMHNPVMPDDMSDIVKYSGSTTGQSHDNEICSPYTISWHVDTKCHRVSPKSFDMMCKMMKEKYDMHVDLSAHGSRKLVDPHYVVKSEYVTPSMS